MPTLFRKRIPLACALSSLLAAGLSAQAAQAATLTWDGSGATANWNYVNGSNTNWTTSARPANGDSLVFAGSTRPSNSNDLGGLSIAGLSFASGAGAFTLGGNAITLAGNITNSSSNLQTLNLPITLGGGLSVWDGGTQGMTINGLVNLGSASLGLDHKTTLNNPAANLTVSSGSNRTLDIKAGSRINSASGLLGDNSNALLSVGVALDGVGSAWVNTGSFTVANLGLATVNISNGASLSDSNGSIGVGAGSNGYVSLFGSGSLWANSGSLQVGGAGAALLSINTGSNVTVGSSLAIGSQGRLELAGGTLQAGSASKASGGQFNWTAGTVKLNAATLGDATGLLAASLSLDASKTLDVAALTLPTGTSLSLAAADRISDTTGLILNGGSFTLNNNYETLASLAGSGGTVNLGSATLTLGGNADSSFAGGLSGAGTLVKAGTGTLTLTGASSVGGTRVNQGQVSIADGGQLANSAGFLGDDSGSNGSAIVTGNGSSWSNSSSLHVGYSGTGSLTIESGGQVSNGGWGYVGFDASGNGSVTVTGSDSIWNNSMGVMVGWSGTGSLSIESGGQVSNTNGYLGYNSGSNGSATVTGSGSLWKNSSELHVGESGVGSLSIESGGQVSNGGWGYVGVDTGGNGSVTVTGSDSIWNNSMGVMVGWSGAGSLSIESGGQVSNTNGYLGYNSGSNGSATVTGSGSLWKNSSELHVGESGAGSLSIESGGQVSNTGVGLMGFINGGTGIATVSGIGSKWSNSSELHVGESGTGSLSIQSGGWVSDTVAFLGKSNGGIGNATVNGSGSLWNNSSELYVGESGTGSLSIESGGQVGNTAGYLGVNSGSHGSATVTGNGSSWINSAGLYVGYSGTGSLIIDLSGQVSSTLGILGFNSGGGGGGSSGSVTGLGSLWNVSDSLYVGRFGVGLLDIAGGGSVVAGKAVSINSISTLNLMAGGLLQAKSFSKAEGGQFNWTGGTLKLTQASVGGTASPFGDSLSLSSSMILDVGTLNVQAGSTLSLGASDRIADTAALNLNGTFNLGTRSETLGSLAGSGTVSGSGNLIVGGNDINTIFDGTLTSGALGKIGVGTQTLIGANNTVSGITSVSGGTLQVASGGRLQTADSRLGTGSGAGNVVVGGMGSQWTGATMTLGNGGNLGKLDIVNGGSVAMTGGVSLNGASVLNLNGGSLSAAYALRSGSGQFNWTAGTVTLGSANLGDSSDLLYATSLTLDANHRLNITDTATLAGAGQLNLTGSDFGVGNTFTNYGRLDIGTNRQATANTHIDNSGTIANQGTLQTATLNNSGSIQLSGAGSIAATTLSLAGGSITGGTLAMGGIGSLSGSGTVSSAISGGSAANTISASGGNLILGDPGSTAGFNFGGVLNVGSNQIVLKDQDKAQLGVTTSLGNGGLLRADNGIKLSVGETLSYSGNASIQGGFTNDGAVSGSGGALTFLNNVDGAGGFGGNINFQAQYSPGNSPAAVDFGGGNASFDVNSVLNMEIFGAAPGSQYDQLNNIGSLSFNGSLNLVFGNGFTPAAGETFSLLNYAVFNGAFDPAKINVTGYDRSLLDFSQLAVNGKLGVTAAPVPLPAAFWLFGTTLAGLVVVGRWRQA